MTLLVFAAYEQVNFYFAATPLSLLFGKFLLQRYNGSAAWIRFQKSVRSNPV
jgi:hypothetical protein